VLAGIPTTVKRDEMLSRGFGSAEVIAYALVGVVLLVGAAALIGQSLYEFVESVDDGVVNASRRMLDTLLLTFIFIELFGAVRVTLKEQRLVAEPFFLVGIIASIKEVVLLIGTEDLSDQSQNAFRQGMIEVGVLAGIVLVLTLCTFIMRRSHREPSETSE
jgi:uncharacterized membrane protein (DUF373 family)